MCPPLRHEGELTMDLELKTKSRSCHARIEESENYEVIPPVFQFDWNLIRSKLEG
jgi:hypothetical protein